jgi:hypothetical protein
MLHFSHREMKFPGRRGQFFHQFLAPQNNFRTGSGKGFLVGRQQGIFLIRLQSHAQSGVPLAQGLAVLAQ